MVSGSVVTATMTCDLDRAMSSIIAIVDGLLFPVTATKAPRAQGVTDAGLPMWNEVAEVGQLLVSRPAFTGHQGSGP